MDLIGFLAQIPIFTHVTNVAIYVGKSLKNNAFLIFTFPSYLYEKARRDTELSRSFSESALTIHSDTHTHIQTTKPCILLSEMFM